MSMNTATVGYDNLVGSPFIPKHYKTEVLHSYYCEAVIPDITRSDFINMKDLRCNSEIVYLVQPEGCTGFDSRYSQMNGDVKELSVSFGEQSVKVCNEQKFKFKFDHQMMERLCNGVRSVYEDEVKIAINKSFSEHVQYYVLNVMLASADRNNIGSNAGVITHQYNLGTIQSPYIIQSNDDGKSAGRLIRHMIAVLEEQCVNSSDLAFLGTPALFTALKENYKDLNVCCGDDNIKVHGKLPKTIEGADGYSIPRMPFVSNAGNKVFYVLMVDRSATFFGANMYDVGFHEEMFETYFKGIICYEAHVFLPKGVTVACIQFQ